MAIDFAREVFIPLGQAGADLCSRCARAAFSCHIVHVFLVGAQEQMCRIATSGIISIGAVVTDFKTVWDRAVGQFPCETMGRNRHAIDLQSTVPIASAHRSGPDPAFAGCIDSCPEAIFWRCAIEERNRACPTAKTWEVVSTIFASARKDDAAVLACQRFGERGKRGSLLAPFLQCFVFSSKELGFLRDRVATFSAANVHFSRTVLIRAVVKRTAWKVAFALSANPMPAPVVARNVANGFSAHIAAISAIVIGDGCWLAATAHAQAGRIRAFVGILVLHGTDLLDRSGMCRAGSVTALPGISLPLNYTAFAGMTQ